MAEREVAGVRELLNKAKEVLGEEGEATYTSPDSNGPNVWRQVGAGALALGALWVIAQQAKSERDEGDHE